MVFRQVDGRPPDWRHLADFFLDETTSRLDDKSSNFRKSIEFRTTGRETISSIDNWIFWEKTRRFLFIQLDDFHFFRTINQCCHLQNNLQISSKFAEF